jgi:hypothetical protein
MFLRAHSPHLLIQIIITRNTNEQVQLKGNENKNKKNKKNHLRANLKLGHKTTLVLVRTCKFLCTKGDMFRLLRAQWVASQERFVTQNKKTKGDDTKKKQRVTRMFEVCSSTRKGTSRCRTHSRTNCLCWAPLEVDPPPEGNFVFRSRVRRLQTVDVVFRPPAFGLHQVDVRFPDAVDDVVWSRPFEPEGLVPCPLRHHSVTGLEGDDDGVVALLPSLDVALLFGKGGSRSVDPSKGSSSRFLFG